MVNGWADLWLGARCLGCHEPGRQSCPRCLAQLPTTGQPAQLRPRPPGLAPVFTSGEYDAWLRGAVIAFKEHRAWQLRAPLAGRLGLALACALAQWPPGPVALVPIPTQPAKIRRRGHDHVTSLVRFLAWRTPGLVVLPLLQLRYAAADQGELGAAERATNMVNTLWVPTQSLRRRDRQAAGARLIVCDDVITTGSTAAEAQRALANVGLGVSAIAVVAATRRRLPLPHLADSD